MDIWQWADDYSLDLFTELSPRVVEAAGGVTLRIVARTIHPWFSDRTPKGLHLHFRRMTPPPPPPCPTAHVDMELFLPLCYVTQELVWEAEAHVWFSMVLDGRVRPQDAETIVQGFVAYASEPRNQLPNWEGGILQMYSEIVIPDEEKFIGAPPSAVPAEGACVICLEDFVADTAADLLETLCHHHFHQRCLRQWLQRGRTYPLCRFPFQ